MSTRQRWSWWLAFAVSLGVSSVHAQPVETNSWAALAQLSPGQRIVVELTQLRRQDGEFVAVIDDAISLRARAQTLTVPRTEVLSVSVRGPSHRLRNTALGAAIGAGVGALAAGMNKGRSERGFVMGVNTLIGLGVGAGIGVALPANRDRTIFRSVTGRPSERRESLARAGQPASGGGRRADEGARRER